MSGWSGLAGQRVGVWGVGVEGTATLRRLEAESVTPAVIVDQAPGQLADGRHVEGLGTGGMEQLRGCDVIVKSPGISPYDEPAASIREGGGKLVGGLGLWLEEAPRRRVACITGTKGKSTTTAIAGAICQGLGNNTFVGGNLGKVPWDPEAAAADWYLIETSSYQARDVTIGPSVVVVTSLGQDHLTWHHGYDNYVRDKLSLCTRPGVETVLVPAGAEELGRHADLLGPNVRYVEESTPSWTHPLGLIGSHNVANALLARAALERMGVPGVDDEVAVRAAAKTYEPLPSRLTRIGCINGVDFVDDSLSTNTLPTLAAMSAFSGRRVALLVGGHERGIDYEPLARGLRARADSALVLTVPDNGPRISTTLRAVAPEVTVQDCGDLTQAVHAAYAWAAPDGVVLLSPAAPSFGVFENYAARADAFAAAMHDLG